METKKTKKYNLVCLSGRGIIQTKKKIDLKLSYAISIDIAFQTNSINILLPWFPLWFSLPNVELTGCQKLQSEVAQLLAIRVKRFVKRR